MVQFYFYFGWVILKHVVIILGFRFSVKVLNLGLEVWGLVGAFLFWFFWVLLKYLFGFVGWFREKGAFWL